jgi:hypothetical protein
VGVLVQAVLADAGWSVWLANSRGRAPVLHTTLNSTAPAFWEWSWDEMVRRPAIFFKMKLSF